MRTLILLAANEIRLMIREWAVLVFAFAFPVLLMVILAGVFGDRPAPEYGGVTPAEYYVADYVAVPLGALTLIGLPVMIASYRERGILRRFEAAGVPPLRVVTAQTLVTAGLIVLGAGVVLAVAAPVYGVPALQHPARVLAGFVAGMLAMTLLGAALGLAARTARSAQAIGLLAFFPMWLLGAGGPPRAVMPDTMRAISDLLPLGHVASAIREPWLGTAGSADNLLALAGWAVVAGGAIALSSWRAGRPGRSETFKTDAPASA